VMKRRSGNKEEAWWLGFMHDSGEEEVQLRRQSSDSRAVAHAAEGGGDCSTWVA